MTPYKSNAALVELSHLVNQVALRRKLLDKAEKELSDYMGKGKHLADLQAFLENRNFRRVDALKAQNDLDAHSIARQVRALHGGSWKHSAARLPRGLVRELERLDCSN